MPRRIDLTWQPGTGGRAGRWRKKYRGRVLYFAHGRSKSDLEGYRQALDAWEAKKTEIDAEEALRPKVHQQDYDRAIKDWTLALDWSLENGDQEHAHLARTKLEGLKDRLSLPKPQPLGFHDRLESLFSWPTGMLEAISSQFRVGPEHPPDLTLRTTVVPSQKALESMDGTQMRLNGAIWRDRLDVQRRKTRDTRDTVEAQIESFLTNKQSQVNAGKLSAGRFEALRVHLRHFRDWLGGAVSVAIISGKILVDYREELLNGLAGEKWSADYLNDRMIALKQWMKWLWRTEAIENLPRVLDTENRDLTIGKRIFTPKTFTIDEVKRLLTAATDRTKLYLLLMLNCGYSQKDISDLRTQEVNWEQGAVTRKRSKTRNHTNVPTVTYRLWPETLRLLTQERTAGSVNLLVNEAGGPLKVEELTSNQKVHKIDNVASAFNRLKRSTNIFKSLKLFRKTSATLLKSNSQFSSIAELFLGHAPRSIADRHYAKAPHELLDDAITWLGTQYGVVQPVVAAKSASTEAGKAKPRTKRKGKKQKCKTSSNATKAQGKKRAFSREVSILEQ